MLRLYVMRHAKSSWAIPGARDFDRELNDRGISDLENMSRIIAKNEYFPEKILCSPAERTTQTLNHVKTAFASEPNIVFTQRLYSSGLEEYMELIRAVDGANSLMIIGHNPMCGGLAASLSGSGEPALLEKIAYKYPTSALSVIDFDCENWSEINKLEGKLVDCIFPSEIRE